MKVGILTHYNVNNQGAQLQMLALQSFIKELGHEVFVLTYDKNFDFVSDDIKKRNIITLKSFPYIFKEFLLKKGFKQTYFNYKKYSINKKFRRENFKYTSYDSSLIDCVVIGSDEVFSNEVGCNNMMYGHGINAKRIVSYAPSFGQTNIDDIKKRNLYELISSGLKKFDYISARDENTFNIISEMTETVPVMVCDPVLLYDFSQLRENIKIKPIKKPYLIVYGYDKNFTNKKEIKAIKKYAKSKNLITVSVGTYHKWCDRNINCDCLQWLKYFENCEEIITDTFHGTILSVISNKPMAVLIRNQINQNKLTHLTKSLKIQDRLIEEISYENLHNCFNKKINFKSINNNLNKYRATSIGFLKNCLTFDDKKNIYDCSGNCSGCGACVNVCPKEAISYELNKYGFYEAIVNKDECINCGLCKRVCVKNFDKNLKHINEGRLFSSYSKDSDLVKSCTSGGVANELAIYGLKNNYYVFGTTYNYENNRAEVVLINNVTDLNKIKGSKYIQSKSDKYISKFIKLCKENPNNKFIVFGTPCQIYGLRKILEIYKFKNEVIMVDLFCHGVPSYIVWDEYLKNIKDKYRLKNISKINFRDKKNGWHNFTISFENNNKKIYIKSTRDVFYKLFFSNKFLNFSCNNCNFRKGFSAADIRLGDYWGKKFLSNECGISAVILNSAEGIKYYNKVKNIYSQKQADLNDFIKYQTSAQYNGNCLEEVCGLKKISINSILKIFKKNISFKQKIILFLKRFSSFVPSKLVRCARGVIYGRKK